MNEKFGYKFLLTHRLNQDCLENFFSQMRYANGPSDHPTPVECLYNIKSIILGKDPGLSLNNHCNTIERECTEYAAATFNKELSDADCTSQIIAEEEYLDEEFLYDIPEKIDYDSDDGPEEFEVNTSDPLDDEEENREDLSNDAHKIAFEECSNDEIIHEQVIDLTIDFIESNSIEAFNDVVNDITPEFINDLSIEMQIDTSKMAKQTTLAEDGLGIFNLF